MKRTDEALTNGRAVWRVTWRVIWRVLGTLLGAGLAAIGCVYLHTPIPWMMGPLLWTALLSVLGVPVLSLNALRNTGQWIIGIALGLYFTPEVAVLVAGLWWVVVLGIVWACLLGFGFGRWLSRMHQYGVLQGLSPEVQRSTTYFAGAIGGASEMTLLAERYQARTDLVASAHSLRVLMVTVILPFAMLAWGVQGIDMRGTAVREVIWPGLAALGGLTGLGVWVMRRLGRANPWLMGGLMVTMGLTLADIRLSALPLPLTNAAQLVIGVSLGVRFTPDFIHTAPRWLGTVALATLVMMGACAAFGVGLAWMAGLHPATLILGTSPGGIAEMAITAKALQLGVPIVTAFQVCRLVAVLILAEPLFRWWNRRCTSEKATQQLKN